MEKNNCKISVIDKNGNVNTKEYEAVSLEANFEYGEMASKESLKGIDPVVYFTRQGDLLLGENDRQVEVLLPQTELTDEQKNVILKQYANEEGNLSIGTGFKQTYLLIPVNKEDQEFDTKNLKVSKLYRDDTTDLYNYNQLTEDEIYDAFKKQRLSR